MAGVAIFDKLVMEDIGGDIWAETQMKQGNRPCI